MISSVIVGILSFAFVFLHLRGRLTSLELIIWGWGTQVFHLPLGNTLTPFFFITLYLAFAEVLFIISNRTRISLYTFLLILLPLLSSICVCIIYSNNKFVFELGSLSNLFFNPLYFYIKYYIPLLLVGHRIYRDGYNIEFFYRIIRNFLIFSLVVAYIRLSIFVFFPNDILLEIIGHKSQFTFEVAGIKLQRVNAFFAEPKYFSYFLGVSMPILFYLNERRLIVLVLITGLLTLSGTFLAFAILYAVSFIFKKLPSLRLRMITVLFGFLMTFFLLEQLKNFIFEYYLGLDPSTITSVLMKRVVSRYDENNNMVGLSFYGVPLQADLEAPVFKYFQDRPYLWFTGYGPGNATLVPDAYFYGTYAYEGRLNGTNKGHIDMGFFFISFEAGILFLLYFIFYATRIHIHQEHQFNFLIFLCSFFFFRGEVLLICYLAILKGSTHLLDREGVVA